MNIEKICNRIIEYSFYAIFLFVPLVLAGDTSELFEFNKMWLAFGLGIVIATAWIAKSILAGRFRFKKFSMQRRMTGIICKNFNLLIEFPNKLMLGKIKPKSTI